MTPRYAQTTQVSADKSRTEIERTLTRYGASSFMYGWQDMQAAVGFVAHGKQVRFLLPLPDKDSVEFTHTATGRKRTRNATDEAHAQAVRQRWRALALVIKAKLEAVDAGIVTFEDEFAMHMVLPGGRAVRDEVLPAIEQAYATGVVRPLLGITAGKESDQ